MKEKKTNEEQWQQQQQSGTVHRNWIRCNKKFLLNKNKRTYQSQEQYNQSKWTHGFIEEICIYYVYK